MKVTSRTFDRLEIGEDSTVASVVMMIAAIPLGTLGIWLILRQEWVFGLFAGLCAAMLLFAAAAFLTSSKSVFDRRTGKITIRNRNVFGSSTRVVELSTIRDATTQSRSSLARHASDAGAANAGPALHRVVLVPVDPNAEKIPICKDYSSGSGQQAAAKAISLWLLEGRQPNPGPLLHRT